MDARTPPWIYFIQCTNSLESFVFFQFEQKTYKVDFKKSRLCFYCMHNTYFLFFTGVCGCCGPLRPRYKRLVDNIFPEDPKVTSLE